MKSSAKHKVFISYSHADERWLKRLLVHLRPLERDGLFDPWSDRRIQPGMKWKDEIRTAIESARVAILLISPDFLASDFIHTDELPPLLRAAEEQGTRIIQVIVSHCMYDSYPTLSKFQAVNKPSKPLNTLTRAAQDALLLQVAKTAESSLDSPEPDNVLQGIPEDEYSRLLGMLDRRQREIHYDAFVSLAMNSLETDTLYAEHRNMAIMVSEALDKHLGLKRVYSAAVRNKTRRDANPATISIRDNLRAIQESRLFVLLHTRPNLASSSLVEAGIALALRIPSLYVVWKDAKLPFLLTRAAQAFEHVSSCQCEDASHLIELIEREKFGLLPRSFEDPDLSQVAARS